METQKPVPSKGLLLLVLTGASLGALVGLYVGLSTSPIVSTIVGTLTSLLTTLVGLKLILDKQEPSEGGESIDSFKIKMVLLSAFAMACIVFTISGMYLRTHNTLSPTLSEKYTAWEKAGFSKEEIKKILLFQELGIQTGKEGISEGITSVSELRQTTLAQSSVLFSAEVDISSCDLLSNVTDDQAYPVLLNNFTVNGGIWEKWALDIDKNIPRKYKKQALLALKESVCSGSSFTISDDDCKSLTAVKNAASATDMNNAIKNNAAFWQTLYQKSGTYFNGDENIRLLFVKTIASTVCS
jgi:hypothetical protein